jgi:hypothetical protein
MCVFDGKLYDYVHENDLVDNVVKSIPGYLEVLVDKGSTYSARGLLGEAITSDHKYNVQYFKNKKYIYYLDLFAYFTDQFKTSKILEHTVKALLGNGFKDINRNPEIVDNTIQWFIRSRELNYVNATGSQDFARALGGVMDSNEYEWWRANHTRNHGLLFDTPVISVDEECILPIDWEWREDYQVVRSNGCLFPSVGNLVAPKFDTMLKDEGTYRHWNRHCYFEIFGDRIFKVYSNTPNNMLLACKRLAAKRDGEREYHVNQKQIVHHLQKKINRNYHKNYHEGDAYLTGVLNLEQIQEDEFDYEGLNFMYEETPFTDYISDQIIQIIDNCSKTTVQTWVDKYKNTTHWLYYKGFEFFLTSMESYLSREYNANITHVKKALRQSYVNGSLYNDDQQNMAKRLNASVKRELAKSGKVPRLFVSYDAGCMYANELPEYVKVCLNGSYYTTCGEITMHQYVMSKPRRDDLDKIFNFLLNALNDSNIIVHVIYSDDSVVAGKINNVPFSFNADISGSDSSIRELLFYSVGLSLAQFHPNRACQLVSQCTQPIRCTNPFNKDEYVELSFNVFLGSGNVLTTVLNHYSSMIWGRSFLYHINRELMHVEHREEIKNWMITSAMMVGVKISVEDNFINDVYIHEKVQFLKHSPMQTLTGKWISTMNIGAIMRSLGTVEDCLTPLKLGITVTHFNSMSYNERLDRFWGGVVLGFKNEPGNPILDALRERFNHIESTKVRRVLGNTLAVCLDRSLEATEFEEFTNELIDNSQETIDPNSLNNRYGSTDDEVADLCHHISCITLGYANYSSMITKIYKQDYDL